MRTAKSLWVPTLIMIGTVVAEAGLDASNSKQANELNIGDIAAEVAQPEGLDAGSLLKDVRRGQGNGQWQSKSTGRIGTGDVNTNDIGGDLANQIVGGGSSSVDQILNNLNGHKQGTNTSNTSQGQRKGHGQGGLQGQSNGRQNGGNAQIIEIKETIIIEANGQRFKTVGIHAERSKSQGASSPIMTAQTQIAPLAGGLNATTSSFQATAAALESVSFQLFSPTSALAAKTGTVTVLAGGEASGAEATLTTSSRAMVIKSATLTPGGLAAITTTAAGSAVIVEAGGYGNGNKSSASTRDPSNNSIGDAASAVPASAGSGGNLGLMSGANVTAASVGPTVTILAGSESGSANVAPVFSLDTSLSISSGIATAAALGGASIAPAAGAVVTVIAGSGSNSAGASVASAAAAVTIVAGSGSNSANGSVVSAAAAVTVIAGSGPGTSTGPGSASAEQAGQNGGCACQCLCPAGSFPMKPPQAAGFQLGSMEAPKSTMQTIASTPSSSLVSVGSAIPDPNASLAMSLATTAGSGAPVMSSALARTSVAAQSQMAADAPQPTPLAAAPSPQNNVPFDISTVMLQSRVTVNLGKRLAKPTEAKRGW